METKTEIVKASESTSAPAETVVKSSRKSTAAKKKSPERAAESKDASKKSATNRSSRTSGRRTAGAMEKASDKKAESKENAIPSQEKPIAASEPSVSEPAQVEISSVSVEAPADPMDIAEKKSAPETEKKPTRRRSSRPVAKTSEDKTSEKASESSVKEAQKAEKETKTEEKTENTPVTEPVAESTEKTSEKPAEKPKSVRTTKKANTTSTSARNKTSASKKAEEKKVTVEEAPAEISEKVSAEAPEIVSEQVEETAVETVVAPESISVESPVTEPQMPVVAEEPKAEVPAEPEAKEEPIDVSGTPHDTFFFVSPGQLAQMEAEAKRAEEEATVSVKAEETPAPAVEEASEAISEIASEEKPETEETIEAESVSEPAQEIAALPVAEPEKPVAEKKPAPQKRGDPHERDVMDKERVRTNIFAVLARTEQIERRTLIEETMQTIPLTDEERLDNQPTSLSNRVRSVIGSVLAEQTSAGNIVFVGRKLSLPKVAEPSPEDTLPEPEEHPLTPEDTASSFEPEHDNVLSSEQPDLDHEEPYVSAKPAPEAEAEQTVAEEAPAVEASAPAEPAPAREPTLRRVRQPRSERSRAPQMGTTTALIITEDEIERVILNSVRRNSATKNDLFAALKHLYVEPHRLSKEEENRIYAVAGNVLQKLVNRGTLQNSDGRYLQKPSQRILNPGRAPGAYSTGNVEARFISELNRQSGDFFEQFAARLLEKYFEMSNVRVDASYVVGGSDDNGIDIMIETTDWLGYKERVFVQAKKRATQPVTLKEVREFYGALCAEEGTRGVFITTSNFCMEASKMIGKIRNLIAIDKRKLFALAEHCEVGLIRDEDGRLLLDENLFLDYDV